jgi:tetratricopeptide (TPR) repeat protein
MDVLTTAAFSGWGIAAAVIAVPGLGAWLVLRGCTRIVATLATAAAAAACAMVAAVTAVPRVDARNLQLAAEASLGHGARELVGGYNGEAWAALDVAEGQFRALGQHGARAQRQSREGLARIELARGDVERLQGRFGEAKARYVAAATRLNALSHADIAWALLRSGHMDLALDNGDVARSAYAQAIPLFVRFGLRRGEAEARLAAGALARQSGAFGEAVTHLETALRLFEGDPLGQGRALVELAWVNQALRHSAEALSQAGAAEALFVAAGAPFGLLLSPFVGAEIAIEDEDGEVAHAHLDRSQSVLDGMIDPLADAARFLGLSATSTLRSRGATGAAVAFPNHHAEARMLLDYVAFQIARGRNQADAVQ